MNFLLLQINDSLFPIGSYTHSFGLESYVAQQILQNQQDAKAYLHSYLHTQILYTDLLSIKLSFEAEDIGSILHYESLLYASMAATPSRKGMQKIGTRFIKTIQSLPLKPHALFESYLHQSLYFMYPIGYATFCKAYIGDFESALKHYMYAQIANALTNCVKLIPLAQSEGQAILYALCAEFDEVYAKLQTLTQEDFCCAWAYNEIKAMQHEYLYSKLYMS